MLDRDVVGDELSVVQTREHGAVVTEVVEQPADVGDDVVDAVVLEAIGNVGLPHAAQIRCHDPVARVGQRTDLMTPTEPRVWEAVQKDDERALPLCHVVHVEPVDSCAVVRPVRQDALTLLWSASLRI